MNSQTEAALTRMSSAYERHGISVICHLKHMYTHMYLITTPPPSHLHLINPERPKPILVQ